MKAVARTRFGILGAWLGVLSSVLSSDALAGPMVWGSGVWGDTWQAVTSVPSLSPPALGLLAAALAGSVVIARRRRPRAASQR
jgi:hypothetical protein